MNPLEKWSFHVLNGLVAISGIAFFWMKYLLQNDDPFSLVNHPWQPWMLKLHILAAPALVFILGLIFSSHISQKLGKRAVANRKSGLLALLLFPVMVLSGYLLQIFTTPWLVRATLILHLSSSAVFVVAYLAHQVISLRLLKKPAARSRKQSVASVA